MLKCPYCQRDAVCVDSAEVYGKSYGYIWLCRPCDAYVGCHMGTKTAKGTLANAELREARKKAHAAFDPIWQRSNAKKGKRAKAYAWLADKLGIEVQRCHIGEFDLQTCARVIQECKRLKMEEA